MSERLQEEKARLQALESSSSACADKSSVLRETFLKLVMGKISGFSWVLRKDFHFRVQYQPRRTLIFCDLIFADKAQAAFFEIDPLLLRGFVRSGARRMCLKWPGYKDGSGIDGLMMHLAAVIYDVLFVSPGQAGSYLELF